MTPSAEYRKYRIWFTIFLIILLSGFFIAALVYNGSFNLWTDPFSRLGASETPEGLENRASMVVFIIVMVLSAIVFGCLTVTFIKDKSVPFRGYRALISIVAAFGACIATFPNNYFLVQHQLGSGFLVGSLWLHAIFFIVDASKVTSKVFTLFLHLLLQSTVLTYAFTFFVGASNRDVVQKFAVIGLALTIELSLAALCKEPEAADDVEPDMLPAEEMDNSDARR